jgi:hypothetical protein
MWLLPWPRPYVDGAVMEEAAFVTERPVMLGPRFDDQPKCLPMTLVHADRIAVSRQHLVRHTSHKSRLESPMGEDVDHCHLLGDADRLSAVGNWIAKDQEPRL